MNGQIFYNLQQADEIKKLKEERDQLLKIHNKVCNQAAEMLGALQGLFKECAMIHKYGGEIDNTRAADEAIANARAAIIKATPRPAFSVPTGGIANTNPEDMTEENFQEWLNCIPPHKRPEWIEKKRIRNVINSFTEPIELD